eukprot:3212154-Heterocapsa_arctica.AAC.1
MGRQIAYMIYAHFHTNPKMDFSNRISDLSELKWHGDHSIPSLLYPLYCHAPEGPAPRRDAHGDPP